MNTMKTMLEERNAKEEFWERRNSWCAEKMLEYLVYIGCQELIVFNK